MTSSDQLALAAQTCEACREGAPLLADAEWSSMQSSVSEWHRDKVDGVDQLIRVFAFDDYASALMFTNKVAELAEEQGHHPAIVLEWGRVEVRWWTHKIQGLHKNDVIMAAKTGALYSPTDC